MRIRRVAVGRLCGSSLDMDASSSEVVDEASKGRQIVGGSDRPGNESTRTLTTGSIFALAARTKAERRRGRSAVE